MLDRRSILSRVAIGVAAVWLTAGVAQAESLPPPSSPAVLDVTGQITTRNVGDKAVFDIAMLEALGATRTVTTTAWTDGKPTFEGVLLSKLMERVGASGATAVAIALNDYKVEIPVEDFRKYPVILAYKMDGEFLKIRDKGPLWIVYPQDDFPALKNKQTQAKWVWQVKELQFK